MSIIGASFAAGGFLRSLLGSALQSGERFIFFPSTDADTGQPLTDNSGNRVYQGFNTYVVISEDHQHTVAVTEHPVEQGGVITDHAYKLPATLHMQIGWSASDPSASGNVRIFGVTLPTFAGLTGFNTGEGVAYIRSIFSQVLAKQRDRSLMTVFTGKRLYQNMLITNVSERTSAETENALILSITFKEVIIASTKTVKLPVNADALADPPAATPLTQNGSKSALPVPPIPPPPPPLTVST